MGLLLVALGIVVGGFLLLLVPAVRKTIGDLVRWRDEVFPDDPSATRPLGMVLVLLLVLAAGQTATAVAWGDRAALGAFWALALTACGFTVGFLFAIPKSVQGDSKVETGTGYRANTNLEQISDWLTKIIVGVTLIKIESIQASLGPLAGTMVAGTGVAVTVALAMIWFYVPFGFLAGYLVTSVFFTVLLARSAQLLQGDLSKLQSKIPKDTVPDAPLTGDAAKQANAIKDLSVNEAVKKQVPLDALSIAQLGTGNAKAALETAMTALQAQAWNPRLHYLKAMALKKMGRQDDAVEALRDARRALAPDTEVELRKAILNSLTFNLLYLADGFRECIEVGREYVKLDVDGADGAVWVNLACAYGQLALKVPESLADARVGALEAVKEALRVKGEWLGRLKSLFAPSAAMKQAGEDDLEVFRGDAEFEKLLG